MTTPVKQLQDESNAAFYPQTVKAAIADYDAPSIEVTENDPGTGVDLPANKFVAVVGEGPSFDDLVFADDPTEPENPSPWVTGSMIDFSSLGFQSKAVASKDFTGNGWNGVDIASVTFSGLIPGATYLVLLDVGLIYHKANVAGDIMISFRLSSGASGTGFHSDYTMNTCGSSRKTYGTITPSGTSTTITIVYSGNQSGAFNFGGASFYLLRVG